MRRWNGITVKLLLAFFAVLLLSFGITTLVSDWMIGSQLRDRSDRLDVRQLDVTAALVRSAYREQWSRELLLSALQMTGGPNRAVYLLDGSGNILLESGNPGDKAKVDPAVIRETLTQRDKIWRTSEDTESGRIRIAAGPVGGPKSWSAQTIVMVSRSFQQDFNLFRGLFRNTMITMLVTATIMVLLVSRSMTARLRRMSEASRRIAKGDFGVRLKPGPRDEIGELAQSLNHMSEELGGLDLMRREFLANVSHDLRSPLTSINGFVEAMLDGAVEQEDQERYLKLVREQTQRMNRLVNDLLDVARMEAGQIPISPVPYNLTGWTRQLLARLEPECSRRGIKLSLSGSLDDVWVLADPDRIDQVLANLLLNAIQFSPNNHPIEVTVEKRDDRACVSVRDYGVGIPPEEQPRIWERFYKSDKARSARSGSGLGLSIVQFVLDKHGTSARVDSIPGQGACFSFSLPLASPSVSASSLEPLNP